MSQKDSNMKLEVKSTNMEVTPAMSDYLTDKLLDLERYINVPEDTTVLTEVELAKNSEHHQSGENLFKAEVNLTISGEMYRAVAEKADMYEAMDEMKDRIMKEIRRNKNKKETMIKSGGRKAKEMLRGIWRKEK